MNVSIMGAGAFGTALGKILVDNGHTVAYYDPKHLALSIEEATKDAEVVIIAIPSEAIEDFCKNYPTELMGLPTILATKGLTDACNFGTFEDLSVLSGPAFAKDIIAGKSVTFTATDELARKLFENDQISIELTDDLRGVMLCGALKNIYAIGAGYQERSESAAAAFLTRAHREMRQYLSDHDANPNTSELACGVGDLAMCCYSPSSRNFLCGQMLREGVLLDEIKSKIGTIEGVAALEQADRQNYPLISEIYALVKKQPAPKFRQF